MAELSYRMLQIDGRPAGLLGLEELFRALYDAGLSPTDPDLPEQLITGVKAHNFIPKPATKLQLTCVPQDRQSHRRQGLWQVAWLAAGADPLVPGHLRREMHQLRRLPGDLRAGCV